MIPLARPDIGPAALDGIREVLALDPADVVARFSPRTKAVILMRPAHREGEGRRRSLDPLRGEVLGSSRDARRLPGFPRYDLVLARDAIIDVRRGGRRRARVS